MVKHVIDTATALGAENVHLIYGHGGELMRERLANEKVNWVFQNEQLGTAHAVQQAAPFFKDDENIVVLYGDAPLISVETLEKLIAAKPENGIALLTVNLANPTGYGRILRENGNGGNRRTERCERRTIKNSRGKHRCHGIRRCKLQKMAGACG